MIQFDTILASDTIIKAAATTAYTAGDVISEVTTDDHYVFAGVGVQQRLSGIINSAHIQINANQATKPDLELWLFNANIANVADNSAFAPTDAEILTLIGVIPFDVSLWNVGLSGSGASGNIAQDVTDINLIYRLSPGAFTLYGQLVVRNAYTPISSESFRVELRITRD